MITIKPDIVGLFCITPKSMTEVITRVNKNGFRGATFTEILNMLLPRASKENISLILFILRNLNNWNSIFSCRI